MGCEVLLRRPIIIIGSARSGTTVLGSLLSHHPEVHYVEEPRLIWRYGNDRGSDMFAREDATPAITEHIRRCFAGKVREAGKSRLVEKTPANSLRIDFVDRIFPDALFIHVLRNGYDAALSIRSFMVRHSCGVPGRKLLCRLREAKVSQAPYYAKELVHRMMPESMRRFVGSPMWGPRFPGMREMSRELSPLDLASLQWRMCVETACQSGRRLPPERYMEIRLEMLDITTLERILQFCELNVAEQVMQAYERRFRRDDATARVKQANAGELEQIRYWIEPTMKWLGYEM